jgi:hypothetical protein
LLFECVWSLSQMLRLIWSLLRNSLSNGLQRWLMGLGSVGTATWCLPREGWGSSTRRQAPAWLEWAFLWLGSLLFGWLYLFMVPFRARAASHGPLSRSFTPGRLELLCAFFSREWKPFWDAHPDWLWFSFYEPPWESHVKLVSSSVWKGRERLVSLIQLPTEKSAWMRTNPEQGHMEAGRGRMAVIWYIMLSPRLPRCLLE